MLLSPARRTTPRPGPRRRAVAAALAAVALLLVGCTGADDVEAGDDAEQADADARQDRVETDVDLSDAGTTGEPVEQERFTVTVAEFDCEAHDPGNDLPAGERCVLTLEVVNDTDTLQGVEANRQVLLDEFGTEYAPSMEATEEAGTPEASVEPGESATIALVYDLPEDVRIVAVRLSDSPGDDGTLVDLMD